VSLSVARWRIENTVTAISGHGDTIMGLSLVSGDVITVDAVANAAGTRASSVAAQNDIRPRRRYTFVLPAKEPLDHDLPLTIDPMGVHFRQCGNGMYLVGCPPLGDDTAFTVDAATISRPKMTHSNTPNFAA
jgi:glycine/D-amino acid oxidase-like deaminating enzyme